MHECQNWDLTSKDHLKERVKSSIPAVKPLKPRQSTLVEDFTWSIVIFNLSPLGALIPLSILRQQQGRLTFSGKGRVKNTPSFNQGGTESAYRAAIKVSNRKAEGRRWLSCLLLRGDLAAMRNCTWCWWALAQRPCSWDQQLSVFPGPSAKSHKAPPPFPHHWLLRTCRASLRSFCKWGDKNKPAHVI